MGSAVRRDAADFRFFLAPIAPSPSRHGRARTQRAEEFLISAWEVCRSATDKRAASVSVQDGSDVRSAHPTRSVSGSSADSSSSPGVFSRCAALAPATAAQQNQQCDPRT
eukprot:4282101-Alexandrium_andersonii.AAC.1